MSTTTRRRHGQKQKKERNIFMTKPGDLPVTKKTIHELCKEFPDKSYRELEIYKEKYEKEHKLRQAAEGETTIVKAIGMNSPEMKAAKQKIEDLQNSLERFRKENSECYNRIADLTDSLESKDYFKDPDYKFLVNENHRLEQQYLEVMADNKKLAKQIEDKMDKLRKSGL